MKASPFSRSALVLLFASATLLFALSILLHAYDNAPIPTAGKVRPSSYATSAIGYAGLFETLKRLGFPVRRGVENALALAGSRGTLIMAEPDVSRFSNAEIRKLVTAPRLLLVLPKWRGRADPDRPEWLKTAEAVPLELAWRTLGLVAGGGSEVFRQTWPGSWPNNKLGVTPAGSGVAQLIRSRELRPVVGDAEGMLVGELRDGGKTVWVLADPDVLSNHGIVRGDNALFAATLVDTLRRMNGGGKRAPVVFDETIHGFLKAGETPVKLLFRFPFVIVTILLCCTAALVLMAGAGRFGAPRVPEPPLDFGKAGLIRNGARLLDYGGHHGSVLKRYIHMTVQGAAVVLHAPVRMNPEILAAWLDTIGKARKVNDSCAAILQTVTNLNAGDARDLPKLFANAWKIYRWKGEILHGYPTDSYHRNERQE